MTRRICAGRWRGGCPGAVPRAGVGPVVRPDAGVGALEEAPAVLVVGPEAAGREDAADEAALLPSGDAQVGLQLADVVAAEVQVGLGAGVLQASRAHSYGQQCDSWDKSKTGSDLGQCRGG